MRRLLESTRNTSIDTTTSTIGVLQSGTITDVNVDVEISHIWTEDLDVQLSKGITSAWLFRDQCSADDDVNATFDDSGSPLICGGVPSISGTVIPEEPLAAFNGGDAAGIWTLSVTDDAAIISGTLNSWCVTIEYEVL